MVFVRAVLASALLCAALAVGAQERPAPSDPAKRATLEPPALAWFQRNAVPFASDTMTRAELDPLVKALEGTRAYGLGEATHGDQQSAWFKTHLIRELVRQGKIDSLMLEINRLPGQEFDAYVNEGKGDVTDLMVNSGLFTIWKTDEFANLIMWLRAHVVRTGKPFRVYGIDCQDGARDLRDMLAWLRRHDRRQADAWSKEFAAYLKSESNDSNVFSWLVKQPRETAAPLLKALRGVVQTLRASDQLKSKPGYDEAVYLAEAAWQTVHAYEQEIGGNGKSGAFTGEYASRRDRYMGQNLLARLGDKSRAALWAHDSHVVAVMPPLAVFAGYFSTGSEIRKALKEQYVSVGFVWKEGVINAKFFDGDFLKAQTAPLVNIPLKCNRPGDLGEFMNRVGPERFWVNLRQRDEPTRAWSQLSYYRGWIGFGTNPATWLETADQATPLMETHDVLVYHRLLSPSTLWALPPKASK